jgi:hypothetical protein
LSRTLFHHLALRGNYEACRKPGLDAEAFAGAPLTGAIAQLVTGQNGKI